MSKYDTSIQFVIYFKELHVYATKHGELKETNRSYRFHPFKNGMINALYLVKKVLLGKMYADLTPQKVIIYQNNQPIYHLPREHGKPICNDRKEVSKIANAINELSLYENQYKKQLVNSLPKVTPVAPNEQEKREYQLRQLRRSVYEGIKSKHLMEKTWTPLESQRAIDELRSRNDENSIQSYFKEHFQATNTPEVETEQKTVSLPVKEPTQQCSVEEKEPVLISQMLPKTTKVLSNNHLQPKIDKDLLASYVDLLVKDYETTDRKATDAVKETFKNAFSVCRNTADAAKVYADFVTKIERGQF